MNAHSFLAAFRRPLLSKTLGTAAVLAALAIISRAQNTPPAPIPAEAAAASTPPPPAPEEETLLDPANPDQLKRYSVDRYEKIIKKSPFAFKIETTAPPPTVSFAADLVLAGFTIDAGKGITYASLVDKKANKRFVIRTDKPNAEGIQLVQLNRGPTLLESAVVARKGSEEATIKSDKEILKRPAVVNAAAMSQPAQQNANIPGRAGQQGNNLNLNLNTNRNGVQQQINGQLQQGGQPPQAGLPPGAVQGGQGQAAPAQAAPVQQQGAPGQGRPGQAPGRRRVILPPQN